MITRTSGLKALIKLISRERKWFDGRKRNSDQWWNNDKSWYESKKRYVCEKDYVWNPATCHCGERKYLASTMDGSGIMCDEIIDGEIKSNNKETKIIFYEKNEKWMKNHAKNSYLLYWYLKIKDSKYI